MQFGALCPDPQNRTNELTKSEPVLVVSFPKIPNVCTCWNAPDVLSGRATGGSITIGVPDDAPGIIGVNVELAVIPVESVTT